MEDYVFFRKMITPVIIQALFWVAVVLSVIYGLYVLVRINFIFGLLMIIFYPILYRILAELILLAFKIYDRLGEIHDSLKAGK